MNVKSMKILEDTDIVNDQDDDKQNVNSEKDEVLDNMLLKDLEENKEYKKDSSFIFRESMLDEFLDDKEK